jgi:phosphoribulokinase
MTHIRPIMIAVGGDSGTGKTTMTRGIYDIFGESNILNICLDDYHTLDREGRSREAITALNPICNNIPMMEEHVWRLRDGESIVKPIYNHSNGTFGTPEHVEPRPIVIIRGLFPLLTERLRSAFDVRVWLDPQDELKYHWKLQRDVAQRGYVVEEVIASLIHRQDDLRQFIMPQVRHADIVVRFFSTPGYLARRRAGGSDEHLPVSLIARSGRAVRFDDVLSKSHVDDQTVRRFEDVYRGERADILEFGAEIEPQKASTLEDALWQRMPEHGGRRPPRVGTFLAEGKTASTSPSLALAQLLLASLVVAARNRLPVESPGVGAQ